MKITLQVICIGLGCSAILIGLMFFILGAQFTAEIFSELIGIFLESSDIKGFDNPDIDGEFRFYSVFWMAYGVALVRAGVNPVQCFRWVPVLAVLFFLGGIGRLLSIITYGWPSVLFQVLLVIELLLPVAMMLLWQQTRSKV